MILQLARRLSFALLPLQAVVVLGFQGRLGWAHDPSCPHHAGYATHATSSRAALDAHSTHAGMAHAAMAHAAMAHEAMEHLASPSPASSPDSSNVPCKCLDPDCCLTGVAAVLAVPPIIAMHGGDHAEENSACRVPESVAPPSAHRTHLLPFPLAPPLFDGFS